MQAATLRHAADTVGEKVSEMAHTVAERAPDVTHKVSEVAHTVAERAPDVTHKVSEMAHTVAERAPDVTHKVGDAAHRLAAKTPWVEEPKPPTHALRTWIVRLAVLAAVGAVGWWFAMRRGHEPAIDSETDTTEAPRTADRRFAAVGT